MPEVNTPKTIVSLLPHEWMVAHMAGLSPEGLHPFLGEFQIPISHIMYECWRCGRIKDLLSFVELNFAIEELLKDVVPDLFYTVKALDYKGVDRLLTKEFVTFVCELALKDCFEVPLNSDFPSSLKIFREDLVMSVMNTGIKR